MTGCGHCSSPESYSDHPCLVYKHGKNYKKRTFQSLQQHTRSSPCKRPELRGRTITATFPGGWLLLNDIERDENFLLWNYSTFESIHLPPLKLDEHHRIHSYVMSRYDGEGIFSLFIFEEKTPCIFVYRSGSGSGSGGRWKTIPYYKAIKDYYKDRHYWRLDLTDPVWCNGKLYALTHNSLVEIEIQLDDDDDDDDDDDVGRKYDGRVVIKSLDCEKPKLNHRSFCYTYALVESCGDMLLIYISVGGVQLTDYIGFDVYRLNQLNWKWEKLDSLGGQDLFLEIAGGRSRIIGFRCGGVKGGGNRIYYTLAQHKYLYCYNMEDNSLHVSLPCPNLTTPWVKPTWVMPFIDDDKGMLTETRERYDHSEFSDTLPSAAGSTAWFVIPGLKGSWTFSDPNIIDVRNVITVPESLKKKGVRIECSKNGWLLLSCYCYESRDFDTAIVFYNPFTKATIHLPNLDGSEHYTGFAFSSSPTSEHCTVVAIKIEDVVRISRWCWGQTDWETFVFENNRDFFWLNFNNPVFWKGSVFFLNQDGKLGVFDRNNRWRAFNKPKKPCHPFLHNFLVYCGGELVSVFIGFMGCSVNVFKLNQLKLVWEKVDSLGDYALFFSRPSSFAAKAAAGMENRIYFPRFYGGRQVYYSLNTNMFHCVGSDETLLDYCGTKEHIECGWIQPPRSSL